MSTAQTRVLVIDPSPDAIVSNVEALSADAALDVQRFADVDTALKTLRDSAAVPPELVVLGAQLSNPLGVARRVHQAAPQAHLVLVANESRASELRAAASPAALIGRDFDIAPALPGELARVVREAARVVRRRQSLRGTLERLNERLARSTAQLRANVRTETAGQSHGESAEELERRVAERADELARVNEALLRSNLELQQFAYVASHDLQSPLRSLAGFAQLLQRDYGDRLDAQAHDWLARIVDNAKRMQAMIRDLLDYSRSDAAPRPFAPVDMRAACADVLQALSGAANETQAQIAYGELPIVRGDRAQLTQLLQNLIDNAIKYRGPEPPRVEITARRIDAANAREWLFAIADNGIGIDARHHQRIFDMFQRLHTHHAYPGTGIGLAICRRVVQRHRGRIWVESVPGRGSVFFFTLPCIDETSP